MSDATETSPPSTGELFPFPSFSQEGSPAKTSAWQAKGQASQGHGVVSGATSTEPFLYYAPPTSSRKTYQRCFFEGWDEFSETFPKSGTMRSGKLYLRQPLVQFIDENESLLWRTPQAQEAGAKVETLYTKDCLPAKVGQRAYRKQPDGRMVLQSVTLNQQVQMWPTPRSHSGASRKPGTGGKCLQEEALKRSWPTPKTGDWRSGCQRRQFNTQLNVEVFRSEGIVPTGMKTQRNPQLNPDWVEWLMGFPIGYTALADSATPSSRKSRRKSP